MWGEEGGGAGVSAGGARVEMGERGEFAGELAFSLYQCFSSLFCSPVAGGLASPSSHTI